MSDNKEAQSSSSSKDDVNPCKKIKNEEEKPKENEAQTSAAAVEVYNPLFVPSSPPGIISKKFKLNPHKWTRGYGTVFANSHWLHTSKLKWIDTLFVKDDEQDRRCDLTFVSSIFERRRKHEFRNNREINRKIRKYVMSKSVYKRCMEHEEKLKLEQMEKEKKIKLEQIENEKKMELEREKKRKAFDEKIAQNIERYVQFAPTKLCSSLRRGVCLWYRVVQFAKLNEYSATKDYVETEAAKNLRELYDTNNFDVDFNFYLGTLHVLFTASNLYRRYAELKIQESRINNKTGKMNNSIMPGTSISQVFDLIYEPKPSQQENQGNEPAEEQPSVTDQKQKKKKTKKRKNSKKNKPRKAEDLVKEMAELYKQIERSNESLQLVPHGELMTADDYIREACNMYGDYLLRRDVNTTDVKDLAHDFMQIYLERADIHGKIQLEFIDFFRQVMSITLSSIAASEVSTEWDKKTVEILAALLEGPWTSPREIYDERDHKRSRVELAFEDVPEKLMDERLGEVLVEMNQLMKEEHQQTQQDKFMQDAITVYTEYLQCKIVDGEDCTAAVQVADELKQIFEQFDTHNEGNEMKSFFDFFELVQNLSLTLIDDFEGWDAKTLKVLVVLLNGPVAQQHKDAAVDYTQEFKEQRGPKYAMMAIKSVLSTVLRRYTISTDFKSVADVKVKADLMIKCVGGYRVAIERRPV